MKSDARFNMEPGGHCAKGNNPATKRQILMLLPVSGIWSSQIHKDRKQNGGCQGVQREG